MRGWLTAMALVALAGCRSADEERREAEERRRAREARLREIRSWHAGTPDSAAARSSPDPVAVAPTASKLLEAENAVSYCEESWRAHMWEALQGSPTADVGTASLRLQKARNDLERVRSGDENVVLERRGGFPGGAWVADWVSGYHREDGVYVQGRPGSHSKGSPSFESR